MNKALRRSGWVHALRGIYCLEDGTDSVAVVSVVKDGNVWKLLLAAYLVNGTPKPRNPDDVGYTFWGKAKSRNQAMRWAQAKNYLIHANGLHASHDVLDP